MIGLKNTTPEEFEYIYSRYNITGSANLAVPTFFFSLIMDEKIIGYVKLTFFDENYCLEEIKYDEGMERFNRFFIKCIAYKIFLKEKKKFYSKVFFDGVSGVEKIKDNLYMYDVETVLEQGKICNGCDNKQYKNSH